MQKKEMTTGFFEAVFDYFLMLSLVLFVFSQFWERKFFITSEENLLYILLIFFILSIVYSRKATLKRMQKNKTKGLYVFFGAAYSVFFIFLYSSLGGLIISSVKRAAVSFLLALFLILLYAFFIFQNNQMEGKLKN